MADAYDTVDATGIVSPKKAGVQAAEENKVERSEAKSEKKGKGALTDAEKSTSVASINKVNDGLQGLTIESRDPESSSAPLFRSAPPVMGAMPPSGVPAPVPGPLSLKSSSNTSSISHVMYGGVLPAGTTPGATNLGGLTNAGSGLGLNQDPGFQFDVPVSAAQKPSGPSPAAGTELTNAGLGLGLNQDPGFQFNFPTPAAQKPSGPIRAAGTGRKPVVRKPRSSYGDMKRKSRGKKSRSWGLYVHRVLKQVHPDTGISMQSKLIMDSFIEDIFERIAQEAVRLTKKGGKATVTSREIQTAVRLILPGELAKHAVSEGTKAVTKYTSSRY